MTLSRVGPGWAGARYFEIHVERVLSTDSFVIL
jgi:hypothetical protein